MAKLNFTTPLLALIITLFPLTTGWAAENNKGRISVTGIGEAVAIPDMATVNLTIVHEANTAQEALKTNNQAMNDVLNALEKYNIADKDIQTSNFSIQPNYVYLTASKGRTSLPRIVGYRVSNALTINVRDIDQLGDILDQSITLGVNQDGNIIFANANPEPLMRKARAAAVKHAIEKANTLAEAAGVEIGPVRHIKEQSNKALSPMMRQTQMSRMLADEAIAVPVKKGQNTYRIAVNVTFEIIQ